jgi:uncharacterized cofD-like protein
MKKIVVIGGGTGTYAVLSGLRKYDLDVAAIITMMDSGGSTGRLRDQYGVLPPGDIRQALVALSDRDKIWRKLFLYRFSSGDLKGHNFGNLFLMALEKVTHSFETSIEAAESVLHTRGSVIPVTLHKTHIVAALSDGTIIKTEALIDLKEKRAPIQQLTLLKKVPSNPKALEAIKQAELIVIAPGDLYTSILPNFMFKDIVQEYRKSKARKVYIANLMNKVGQTDGFELSQYINVFEKYLGKSPFTDIMVNDKAFPSSVMEHYRSNGESVVECDISSNTKMTLYKKDFISDHVYSAKGGDQLERSLLRHDSSKVAKFIWKQLINQA